MTTTDGDVAVPSPAANPFHDLDAYNALPRLSGLTLSPDGRRLVTSVSVPNPEGTGFRNALWEVDPTGSTPARQLTRSSKGESGAQFTQDGSLLFTSSRADSDSKGSEDSESALWLLPESGEARAVLARSGGVNGIFANGTSKTVVLQGSRFSSAKTEEQDAELRKLRKEKKVAAILHTAYPVRYWDQDLSAETEQLFAVDGALDDDPQLRWISAGVGAGLLEAPVVLSPDGTFLLAGVGVQTAKAETRYEIVRIDIASGERKTVLSDPDFELSVTDISPDGTHAALIVSSQSTVDLAPQQQLWLIDLNARTAHRIATEWDRWPSAAYFSVDGTKLYILSSEGGSAPIFELDLDSEQVHRLTAEEAHFSNLVLSAEGGSGYALRDSYGFPPEPVRIDLATGEVTALLGPAKRPDLPATIENVSATAEDGSTVRAWLVLPKTAGPHPLLLWVHGGPLMSWNGWAWRWNPMILAERGYAVLLPDPALSDGYGQDFVQRGWGKWGEEPFTDLMAITDAVVARPDIDESRTAAMGGSFGGYMANWIAGHSNRFKAIVTHASLWNLPAFGSTTDHAEYWSRELSPEAALRNSPHAAVGEIQTPMLVIHGDKDYRVPISEGLGLWFDLNAKSKLPMQEDGSTVHEFLYFPDENHWILKPQHAKIWYHVVERFLAKHVLGEDVELPKELGL